MTFYEWLIEQRRRNDPVGDLSRDFRRDQDLPANKSYQHLLSHLWDVHACDGAIDAMRRARREWIRSTAPGGER